MTKVFPSILPENFVDDSYSEAELSRMDWDTLRAIASSHPDEEVNGRMGKADIIAALTGKQRV
jgi:hypothetical protein